MTFAVLVASASRKSPNAFLNQSKKVLVNSTSSRNFQSPFQRASSTNTSASEDEVDSQYHTVAITGSSGMLGTALIDELSKKKDMLLKGKPLRIVKLIRSDSIEGGFVEDDKNVSYSSATLNWNPKSQDANCINAEAIQSIDTVVHLAGENVGTGLLPGPLGALGIQAWSKEKKDLIMSSRVGPTNSLATAIAECSKPTTFIVASGVGVYGSDFMADNNEKDTPDESMDVSKTEGFLAEISRRWEAASEPVIEDKALSRNRLVNLRLAPILSKYGGALEKLYPIFFLGGGGVVGSGIQYFSYISARDAARAIVHVIENESVRGPVNLVAPTPATNTEFTSVFGKILSRPTIIPLPGFAVKLLFGEMGEEMLLGGVKAAPKKLLDSGFEFEHKNIEEALQSAMDEKI